MRKLQIGDTLIIRPRLSVNTRYDSLIFTEDMKVYRSREATITAYDEDNEKWYHVDIDNGEWSWSEAMFTKESFEQATKDRTFKEGDYVRIISKEEYDNAADLQDCMFNQIGRIRTIGETSHYIDFRGCQNEKNFTKPSYLTWWIRPGIHLAPSLSYILCSSICIPL